MLPLEVKPLAFPLNQLGNKKDLTRPNALPGHPRLVVDCSKARGGERHIWRNPKIPMAVAHGDPVARAERNNIGIQPVNHDENRDQYQELSDVAWD